MLGLSAVASDAGLGQRLARARDRAGFSQEEVATLLVEARPLISYWETGARIPNSHQLDQLARLYRVAVEELVSEQDEPRPKLELLMFRDAGDRLAPLGKLEVQRFLGFLDDYGDFLETLGEPPGLQKSPFGVTSSFTTKEDIRKKAENARRWLGLGDDGPVGDLFSVADLAGIAVCLGAMGQDLDKSISGAFVPHPRVGFSILLNAQTTPGRQQFTLAHELGHALFHGDHPYVGYLGRAVGPERFADAFAAEFLVPVSSLRATVEKLGLRSVNDPEIIVHLQRLYQVSYSMMLVRLRAAQLLEETELEQLRNIRPVHLAYRLGYSVGDEEWSQDPTKWGVRRFPPRFGRLLKRELIAGNMSPASAAEMTGLAAEDIEDLLRSHGPQQGEAKEFDYIRASA